MSEVKTIKSGEKPCRGNRANLIIFHDGINFVGDVADPILSDIMNIIDNVKAVQSKTHLSNAYSLELDTDREFRLVIDERYLDDQLLEHYSGNHNKWFNNNTAEYIVSDNRTAYEIDGFDEYSQQPLSEIHMLDRLHDDIYALENMSYKEFMLMTLADYVGIMNCLRLRVRNMGWK